MLTIKKIKTNPMMLVGVGGTLLLQFLVMEVPVLSQMLQTVSVPILYMVGLFGIALIILFIIEGYKQIMHAVEKE